MLWKLIRETLSIVILDSEYTNIVCSKTLLNYYLECLSSEELDKMKRESCKTILRFGLERLATPLNWSQYQ